MDFVALEFLADAIGPRQQIKNVGRIFQMEEPQCLIARDGAAVQSAFAKSGNASMACGVNQFQRHA